MLKGKLVAKLFWFDGIAPHCIVGFHGTLSAVFFTRKSRLSLKDAPRRRHQDAGFPIHGRDWEADVAVVHAPGKRQRVEDAAEIDAEELVAEQLCLDEPAEDRQALFREVHRRDAGGVADLGSHRMEVVSRIARVRVSHGGWAGRGGRGTGGFAISPLNTLLKRRPQEERKTRSRDERRRAAEAIAKAEMARRLLAEFRAYSTVQELNSSCPTRGRRCEHGRNGGYKCCHSGSNAAVRRLGSKQLSGLHPCRAFIQGACSTG